MRLMGLINEVKDFSEIPQFRVLKLKKLQKSWHLQKIKVEVCLESMHWHLSKTPEVKAKTPH